MPDIESHIDTVGGDKFITVCDIQSAYHQIGVKADEQDKTAFVCLLYTSPSPRD